MERSLDSTLLTKRFVLQSSNLKSFPLSFLSDVAQVGVNDFEFIRVIGKGSFGKVKLVRKKSDGKLYAMKVICLLLHFFTDSLDFIKTEHCSKETSRAHQDREKSSGDHQPPLYCEIALCFPGNPHSSFLTIIYFHQTNSKLYFILDYAAGGELFFHLSRMKKFPEHITKFFSAEITSALDALHKIVRLIPSLSPHTLSRLYLTGCRLP